MEPIETPEIEFKELTELEKWNCINAATTINGLAAAIRAISDKTGNIAGKSSNFTAEEMVERLYMVKNGYPYSALTRAYGIRQQAAYLFNKD